MSHDDDTHLDETAHEEEGGSLLSRFRRKSLRDKLELGVAFVALLLILTGFVLPAHVPSAVVVNKKLFNKEILITDLLNGAISAYGWNLDDERSCNPLVQRFWDDREAPAFVGQEQGPENGWWRDYMKPGPEGWPRKCTLHRWEEQEIRISADWPSIGPLREFPAQREPVSAYSSLLFDSYNIVEDQVRSILPYIARATGRTLVFVPPGHADEYTPRFAQIRIVPVSKPAFKVTVRDYLTKIAGPWDINTRDYQFWGGVPFTAISPTQVDGYLLPRPDNTLGMAVCKFYPGYPPPMVRAMITECVMRAMGLPEIVYFDSGVSVLGPWNQNYYRAYNADVSRYMKVSLYDMIMLRMLYCPALKSGMTKGEAADVLLNNIECFEARAPLRVQDTRGSEGIDMAPQQTKALIGTVAPQ